MAASLSPRLIAARPCSISDVCANRNGGGDRREDGEWDAHMSYDGGLHFLLLYTKLVCEFP